MPNMKNVKVQQEPRETIEKKLQKAKALPTLSNVISEANRLRMETYHTPKHMWARLTPQGTVQVGVSDYFLHQFRGIIYVETGNIGAPVTKDKPFGVVETVDGWPFVIHDMYSPIEGEMIRINQKVIDDAYTLNNDPYQWIVEIQPTSTESKKELAATLGL
jgi:glycine cleavage system H protein